MTAGIGAWNFGYDSNGNLAQAQLYDAAGNVVNEQRAALGRQVTVDLTGRVSRIVRRNAAGTLETSYAYNTFGLRVFKSPDGSSGGAQLPSPGSPCPPPGSGPEPMRVGSLETFSPISAWTAMRASWPHRQARVTSTT